MAERPHEEAGPNNSSNAASTGLISGQNASVPPSGAVPPNPSPQSVGREFVRQYYTILNRGPNMLHRFYSYDSSLIHAGLDYPEGNDVPQPVYGQGEIEKKIASLNFQDCHAKIRQVDSLETVGKGVVIQVSGELSNNRQPMRRFHQTFVLVPQSNTKYYVRNDIFRYQDDIYDDESSENAPASIDNNIEKRLENKNQPAEAVNATPVSTQIPVAHGDVPFPNIPKVDHAVSGSNGALGNDISRPSPVDVPKNPESTKKSAGEVEDVKNFPRTKGEPLDLSHPTPDAIVTASSPAPPRESPSRTADENVDISPKPEMQGARSWAQTAALPHDASKPTQPSPSPMPPNINRYEIHHHPQQQSNQLPHPKPNNSQSSKPSRRDPHQQTRSPKDNRDGTPLGVKRNEGMDGGGYEIQEVKGGKQYPDNQQVFVGNLSRNHGEDELRKYFSKYGKILDVRISRQNQKNSGSATPNYGFVTFESPDIVQQVLSQKPIFFGGHRFNVEAKRPSGGRAGNGPLKSNDDNRSNPNRGSNMKNDRREARNQSQHHFQQGSQGGGGGASNLSGASLSGPSPGNRGGGGGYGGGGNRR